jgi:hypothetical protein
LRSNTKGYGGKTHKYSDTTAPSGRELYHLQFSLQAAGPETFGYTLVFFVTILSLSRQLTGIYLEICRVRLFPNTFWSQFMIIFSPYSVTYFQQLKKGRSVT